MFVIKKRILFIYPSMILGGSTTALLSLINNLDGDEYQIDLQLQKNAGPLFEEIPKHVNILPEAQKYSGRIGKIIKVLRFVLQGEIIKAFLVHRKYQQKGLSSDVKNAFLAKSISNRNTKHYDYAISFLEGWSGWYLANNVYANKKYAWQHSTFSKITSTPNEQVAWMSKVDKIIFVDDACTDEFKNILPCFAEKAITIKNITDSEIIRNRSNQIDVMDEAYKTYKEAKCFKIITVCRIVIETKGLDRIVSCAKALKHSGCVFLWYLVGDGPDKQRLMKMIKAAGIQDSLVLVGARFNPYPIMKEADIMCMPSRYEGKPMAITESMILGVPAVVTEYLSAHQQIQNGINGIVVNNDDESITYGVLECLRNKELLSHMKKALIKQENGNKAYIQEIRHILFE